MPPERSFGTEISANRWRLCESNPVQRAAMCTELSQGKTYRAVAQTYKCSPSTAHSIFKRWNNAKSFENKPRSGRPKKLTPSAVIYITLMIKKDRRITRNALVGAMDGRISKSTIRRALQKEFHRKWRSMQRIPISPETATTWLRWAQAWKEDEEELMKVWRFEITPFYLH